MPNFVYNSLEENVGISNPNGYQDVSKNPIKNNASTLTAQNHAAETSINESGVGVLRISPSYETRSENVRYTALRPTVVRELSETEVDIDPADLDGTDSAILVTTASDRKSIPKIYAIICGLLIACVIIVAFGLIYTFIILPTYSEKNVNSDPRIQSEDLIKKYGENVVRTSCGLVRGIREQDVFVFKGIPYSLPPTGARRWKLPVARDTDPSTCWKGVFNASQFGSKCVQPNFNNTHVADGDENCLFLNVWTPALSPRTLLPVMVWFHSGDFIYGSGHVKGMTPTPGVVIATNFVYVSFNYRLGVFGFLALDELRDGSERSAGNYGFMDQILVLKWVQKNIQQFGGNASMVTIFGHGSGATSIQAMLLSPGSKGLFQKAWLTSPVAVLNKTVDEACSDNKAFLKSSGCSSAECLRDLTAQEVSRSSPWTLQPHWTLPQLFHIPSNGQIRNDLPIFDGLVVPRFSQQLRLNGPAVPVVFGSTYFDVSGLDTELAVMNMTLDYYKQLMDRHLDSLGSEAVTQANYLYSDKLDYDYSSHTHFPPEPSVQFLHLLADIKNVCPVKLLVDFFLNLYFNSANVFMYVSEIYPTFNIKLSSKEENTFIGWDIVSFFGTFEELGILTGQGELNFQSVIRQEMVSFVKYGQPDAKRWKPGHNVGVIGRDVTVNPETDEYFSQCRFWKEHGFFNYTWD